MRAQKVLRSFPLDGSEDRMVLLSWSIDPEPVQRNVARVDRHGNVIWRAEMPTTRSSDCFNALARCQDVLGPERLDRRQWRGTAYGSDERRGLI